MGDWIHRNGIKDLKLAFQNRDGQVFIEPELLKTCLKKDVLDGAGSARWPAEEELWK